MKTNCLISLISALFLLACQRELSYPEFQPAPPVIIPDSITLVESVTATNYDKNNNFLWKSRQSYHYDFANRKSVITFTDSTGQSLRTYTETFFYDTRNRLSSYETTNSNVYFKSTEFKYQSNGEVEKAIFYLTDGRQLENVFQYSTSNNLKVLTMIDTAKIGGRHPGYRPQIIRYSFDQQNRLVQQFEYKTGPNKTPQNWLKDTFNYKFSHDGPDVRTMIRTYTYASNGVNSPVVKDSVTFFRENSGVELYDSYRMIYKNLYWVSFSEYANNSFANSMVHNGFYPHYIYYFSNPIQQIEYWSAVNLPIYKKRTVGDFVNTFDQDGRLIRSLYPRLFARTYDGTTTLEYNYIRIPE